MTVLSISIAQYPSVITDLTFKTLPAGWSDRQRATLQWKNLENTLSPVSPQTTRGSKWPFDPLGPQWQEIILKIQRAQRWPNWSREEGMKRRESCMADAPWHVLSEYRGEDWLTQVNPITRFSLVPLFRPISHQGWHHCDLGHWANFVHVHEKASGPFNFQEWGFQWWWALLNYTSCSANAICASCVYASRRVIDWSVAISCDPLGIAWNRVRLTCNWLAMTYSKRYESIFLLAISIDYLALIWDARKCEYAIQCRPASDWKGT